MSSEPAIRLRSEQRRKLQQLVRAGRHKAREVQYAYILLRSADGWSETQIAQAFDISPRTVRRTRARFRESGLGAALAEQPRPGQPLKLSVVQEASLVALACSAPPAGHRRWTVRLLTEEAVRRRIVPQVVPETARRVLKKTRSSLGA